MMGTTPELKKLSGAVPVSHSPGLEGRAREVGGYLTSGRAGLVEIFRTEAPDLRAMLLTEEDWSAAPRESERPYPFGLPYFTRSTTTPTLVFPSELSGTVRPRTDLTLPLTVWHELAHAFLLKRETVKVPLWLGEFVPQAAAAAVALGEGLSLEGHLSQTEEPDFTVREFELPASGRDQMLLQNLLLSLGAAAIREFGDEFLAELTHSMWSETEIVDRERAEELLAASLGAVGREWLEGRPEFRGAS